MALEVQNDQPLAGLDIALRFGQPGDSIILDRVEWSSRVDGWESKNALIDNDAKTVIVGLVSELVNVRANADLGIAAAGEKAVAHLVFKHVGSGGPRLQLFRTDYPFHELLFFHNRYEDGKPIVEEFKPDLEMRIGE